MWWPLRRRGGRHSRRVVFIGPGGDAPWDRRDAEVLQAAWEALASLDDLLGPDGSPGPPAPARTSQPADTWPGPEPAAAVPASATPVEQASPVAAPAPSAEEEPDTPAVWLGFADGSRLVLAADDPAAAALRAVADRLTTSGVER